VIHRQRIAIGSVVWAVTGAIVALASLPSVNPDARWLVAAASLAFPTAALFAGVIARRGASLRWSGVLLLISTGTPTYFFWVINLPAFAAGLALLKACESQSW
jgi:hypothetical protein